MNIPLNRVAGHQSSLSICQPAVATVSSYAEIRVDSFFSHLLKMKSEEGDGSMSPVEPGTNPTFSASCHSSGPGFHLFVPLIVPRLLKIPPLVSILQIFSLLYFFPAKNFRTKNSEDRISRRDGGRFSVSFGGDEETGDGSLSLFGAEKRQRTVPCLLVRSSLSPKRKPPH